MNRPNTADQSLIRKLNTSHIMDCIRLYAPLSRADISVRTGLNRSTVSSIVDELINRGFVHETNLQDSRIGRPGILLQFNPNGGFAVGVEIGVDFLSVILTNFVAEVLWNKQEPFDIGMPQTEIMDRAENLVSEAMHYGREHGLRPLGIGVGTPGLVDASQGKLVFAPNLKWVDMPIRRIWMQRFNLPVFVENEANCAAMGEYFYGVAHGVENFIYLKTGVGLGGGIMMGGKLYKGASGYAGEIGHTIINDSAGGELCGCGRRGCWETYVSQSAILRRANELLKNGQPSRIREITGGDLSKMTFDTVVKAAGEEDAIASQIFREIGTHLAVGIANLVNIFNPELVVLGGTLSLFNPWLIPVIDDYLKDNILFPLRGHVSVEPSAHGLDACVIGAVALVLDDIVREPLY